MYYYWVGLSPIAVGFFVSYLEARRYGRDWFDWSFVHNRTAMLVGGAVGAFIVATNLGSRWTTIAWSIVPALLVGSLVALTVHRYQGWRARRTTGRP